LRMIFNIILVAGVLMDKISFIEPEKDPGWDQYVAQHPHGWICHLSGWKKVLEKSFAHMKGYYPVLVDEAGVIKAGLPVFALKSRLTGNRLVSIPYATLCDPLVTTADQMEKLLQALLDLAADLRMKTSEIRTFRSGLCSTDDRLWHQDIYKHHYITLDREPEKLRQSFDRTNVRQRIRRALNSNLTVEEAEHASDMDDFYKLHILTRKKLGLPPQPLNFFKHLWDIFAPSRQLTLLFAKKDNEILSSIILFKFRDRVSVEFLASNEAFMCFSPNHMLFWSAIQDACKEGYKIFDFGRTSVTNESLMKFKKRWGAEVVDLPQYFYPKHAFEGCKSREETLAYQLIKKAVIKLPDNACLLFSKFLYRHLG
jgi:hypothetical protein